MLPSRMLSGCQAGFYTCLEANRVRHGIQKSLRVHITLMGNVLLLTFSNFSTMRLYTTTTRMSTLA